MAVIGALRFALNASARSRCPDSRSAAPPVSAIIAMALRVGVFFTVVCMASSLAFHQFGYGRNGHRSVAPLRMRHCLICLICQRVMASLPLSSLLNRFGAVAASASLATAAGMGRRPQA